MYNEAKDLSALSFTFDRVCCSRTVSVSQEAPSRVDLGRSPVGHG